MKNGKYNLVLTLHHAHFFLLYIQIQIQCVDGSENSWKYWKDIFKHKLDLSCVHWSLDILLFTLLLSYY